MIYLVTRQQELYQSDLYTVITADEALSIMKDWVLVQYDSETTGRY